MPDKSILTLKTGLFDQDDHLDAALGDTDPNLQLDLATCETDADWDEVIKAVMDHDLIITL